MFNRSTHTLERIDPDISAAIANEHRRQEQHIELIASENYASPAVLAAQGSQLTNKYAEGYPGKRYYGGCEYRRRCRNARDRTPEAIVRRAGRGNLGQRTAALGCTGQRSRVSCAAYTRRHDHGDEPGRRWPSDAWHATEHQRQVVQGRQLRTQRSRGNRLRRIARAGAAAQTEVDHRRCFRLFAANRLRALCECCARGRRVPDGRHGALRGPDRRGRVPEPDTARRCDHVDHAQNVARAARRPDPDEAALGKGDQLRGVPRACRAAR